MQKTCVPTGGTWIKPQPPPTADDSSGSQSVVTPSGCRRTLTVIIAVLALTTVPHRPAGDALSMAAACILCAFKRRCMLHLCHSARGAVLEPERLSEAAIKRE